MGKNLRLPISSGSSSSLGRLERNRTAVTLLGKLPVLLPCLIAALRQVQIVGVEISKASQPLDIRDGDGVAFQCNHPLQAELPHNAVEMHSCHGQCVGELPLCQRQHEAVVGGEPYSLKAHEQFAYE